MASADGLCRLLGGDTALSAHLAGPRIMRCADRAGRRTRGAGTAWAENARPRRADPQTRAGAPYLASARRASLTRSVFEEANPSAFGALGRDGDGAIGTDEGAGQIVPCHAQIVRMAVVPVAVLEDDVRQAPAGIDAEGRRWRGDPQDEREIAKDDYCASSRPGIRKVNFGSGVRRPPSRSLGRIMWQNGSIFCMPVIRPVPKPSPLA